MYDRRASRGGFTLLEILLVVAIIGIIAAMVAPALLGRQQQAMIDTTRASIKGLEQALKLYAINHDGNYPEGDQGVVLGLMDSETRDDGTIEAAYLDERPADAWGELLFYEYPNNKAETTKPAIWSSGPDKKNDDGGGDDINN